MLTTLIDEGLICLELAAHDKQALFVELAARLKASGKIASEEQFVRDLWAREELTTPASSRVALPHAKSEAVREPAIVVGISRRGIDYGAEDGEPSKLFFMIASPAGGANHHIEVLAELSTAAGTRFHHQHAGCHQPRRGTRLAGRTRAVRSPAAPGRNPPSRRSRRSAASRLSSTPSSSICCLVPPT